MVCASFMDPAGDGVSCDAGEAWSEAVDDLDVRDLDRELAELLADQVPIGATVGAAPDRSERLERLAR